MEEWSGARGRSAGAVGRLKMGREGGMSNYVGRSTVGHERQSDGDEGNEQPWLFHHDPVADGSGIANKHSTRRSGASKLTRWPSQVGCPGAVASCLLEARFCLSLRRDERL